MDQGIYLYVCPAPRPLPPSPSLHHLYMIYNATCLQRRRWDSEHEKWPAGKAPGQVQRVVETDLALVTLRRKIQALS